jgi:hypothetical protein
MSNQIETQVDVSLTERNRLTAFFRIILVVPAFIFVSSFAPSTSFSDDSSAILAGLLALPAGLAIVFRQVYPSYVLAFNEALLSLQTRVDVYLLLLSDEYPSIEENDVVSVTFPEVDAKQLNRWLPLVKWLLALPLYLAGIVYIIYAALLTDEYPSIEENEIVSVTFPEVDAKQLNRWLPLIKWLLALPLYLVGLVYLVYAALLTLLGWFSILLTGNYPEVCAEGIVGTIAYWNRVVGYAFLLVTDEYPTFSL